VSLAISLYFRPVFRKAQEAIFDASSAADFAHAPASHMRSQFFPDEPLFRASVHMQKANVNGDACGLFLKSGKQPAASKRCEE